MQILYSIPGLRRGILVFENLIFNAIYGNRLKQRVSIFGFPILSLSRSSTIKIGKNLVLISHSYFSAPGVNHPVIIRTLHPQARLTIGDNVGMSGGAICVACEVTIGSNVMLGANVMVTDSDFHPVAPAGRRTSTQNIGIAPVWIENNVFVGANTTILKGAHVGENSVIGAGSIVTGEIPPNTIAAGIPARVIGNIDDANTGQSDLPVAG